MEQIFMRWVFLKNIECISGFNLRNKNKLLLKTKGIGIASHTGKIKSFPITRPNLMWENLSPFSCWLLTHIKVYYINTSKKFYFFNVGLKIH